MFDLNAQSQAAQAVQAATSSHLTALQRHNVQVEAQQKMQAARELSLRSFYPDELSADQERMVAALAQFFGSEQQVFLLKGFAGTGKTFLLSGILHYLSALGWQSLSCAPTGKAAQVLRDKTGDVNVWTIHKAIYDFNHGHDCGHQEVAGETLKREDYDSIIVGFVKKFAEPSCFVMLVDESSMISDQHMDDDNFICGSGKLLTDIFSFLQLDQYPGRKVIFIGDEAQLPPVGSQISPALSAQYIKEHFGFEVVENKLSSIVRQQAQSAILQSSLQLRQGLQNQFYQELAFPLKPGEVETAYVQYSLYQDLARRYQEALSQSRMPPLSVICLSNATALGYNLWIRHFLFGLPHFDPSSSAQVASEGNGAVTPLVEHPLDVRSGDLLLVLRNNYQHELFNGQLVVLGSFDPNAIISRSISMRPLKKHGATSQTDGVAHNDEWIHVTLKFLPVELWRNTTDGKWLGQNVMLLTNALYSPERSISRDEQRALFVDFVMRHPDLKRGSDEFKQQLKADPYYNAVQVHFGYAMTCHKAQGSEWEQVFVDCNGAQQANEQSFRWLYTAITRAKSQLTLINYSARKVASKLKIASTFKHAPTAAPGATSGAAQGNASGALTAPTPPALGSKVVSEPGWTLDAPSPNLLQEPLYRQQVVPRPSVESMPRPELAQPLTPLQSQSQPQLRLEVGAALAQSNAVASSPAEQLVAFCAQYCRQLDLAQLRVSHLASLDYQEKITISDENAGTSMIVQVFYDSNDCYSRVFKGKCNLNQELSSNLVNGLQDALRGRARFELTQARRDAVAVPPPVMGNVGFNQYLQRLQAQLANNQIVTVSWQQLQYVLRVKFQAIADIDHMSHIAAGENVELDIGYNGKYEITNIKPARKGEGNKPLGQVVIEIISNL